MLLPAVYEVHDKRVAAAASLLQLGTLQQPAAVLQRLGAAVAVLNCTA
jgi:hypothetical protein